jgi:hypothetical protein
MDAKQAKAELGRKALLQCVKDGEFDPKEKKFSLELDEHFMYQLAYRQMISIRDDLSLVGRSPDYQSAADFIGTQGWVSLCQILGLDVEEATAEAALLRDRHSDDYLQVIDDVINSKTIDRTNIDVEGYDFAVNLADRVFEMRNQDGFEYYSSKAFLLYLDFQGIKSNCFKHHLTLLLNQLNY